MKTFIEQQHGKLITKFHTLLGKAGMDEFDKKSILDEFGVTSSKELTVHQLIDICDTLQMMANPEISKTDKLRKRVIASIGAYLRIMHEPESIDRIKSIACRASGERNFNQISDTKLRSIYNAFNQHKNAMVSVSKITEDILLNQE